MWLSVLDFFYSGMTLQQPGLMQKLNVKEMVQTGHKNLLKVKFQIYIKFKDHKWSLDFKCNKHIY